MASLNLSINGPSIKSSYNGVVNASVSSNSPTYAHWALFMVSAPLQSAFQDAGKKESVLKVQSTGDGDLANLFEDFNEGRMQFAFVKVNDPNTGRPKTVLIAWCGVGVAERNKELFPSHLDAVTKVLHGYSVQISARSDNDLDPSSFMQKVADAPESSSPAPGPSAASARAPAPKPKTPAAAPPPVKTKPLFTSGQFSNPLVAARYKRDENVDEDGWGADAPPVTRTTVERVESSYKPTKVNMAELTSQKAEPSRFNASAPRDDDRSDVVKGGYQPVGKVDIAALRAQAKNQADDRPAPVKGSYEPVGKVDIAAIRARSQPQQQQQQRESEPAPAQEEEEREEESRPLADRAAAFSQPSGGERLTSLPKPKVANKFGGGSGVAGTKPLTPGALGLGGPSGPPPTTVGSAGRTFAASAGKTPAQLWAEKKARERGDSVGSNSAPSPAPATPVQAQPSGGSEWKSGYTGKSWGPVQTSGQFGRGAISRETTGEPVNRQQEEEQQQEQSGGGVSALKDRFKGAAPMGGAAAAGAAVGAAAGVGVAAGALAGAGAAAYAANRETEEEADPEPEEQEEDRAPPPIPSGSRPNPAAEPQEEADEFEPEREESPARVAAPVGRGAETPEERPAPPVPEEQPEEPEPEDTAARGAAQVVAEQTFEPEQVAVGQATQGGGQGGHRAVAQYDYDKAEDNEIDLMDGETITRIEMVDEDWWMGTNSRGEVGLFPSNYVELVEGDGEAATPGAPAPDPIAAQPAAPVPAAASSGPTATALYDYEAAEDNELSFPEDAKITDLEFPDEDWWLGSYGGHKGLFPANYVQLDQ